MMQPASRVVQDEPAEVRQASVQQPSLRLGPQQRSSRDEVVQSLDFSPAEEDGVSRIRAEVEVGEGPWRFRKAEAPSGSSLRISTRQRRAERTLPSGEKQRLTVISLVITSSARAAIPRGPVATLRFSLSHPATATQIPVILREWEAAPLDPSVRQHPPAMEPPAAEPPRNPAATCFFFAH